MLDKDYNFWKPVANKLQLKGYIVEFLRDYAGRFFDHTDLVLSTNAPKNLVIALIGVQLNKDGNIDEIENLSITEFEKDYFLYY